MAFIEIAKSFFYISLIAFNVNSKCPESMTNTGSGTCIDIYPIGASENELPILGLSALYEDYIDLKGVTWDLKTICESRGKRVCNLEEWSSACEGTDSNQCPPIKHYIPPDWDLVARRNKKELLRLNQYSTPNKYPKCKSNTGARMMLNSAQEWVISKNQYVLTRGFWSREGKCHSINTTHNPRWHDYATTGRCCTEFININK